MRRYAAGMLFMVTLVSPAWAQINNGTFATGDLSGWNQSAFRDASPSVFTSLLTYGTSPTAIAFRSAQAAGTSAASSNGVAILQSDNFDGNGPFVSSTPISSPSGTSIAFISNHDANAATDGNTLVGSSIFQTFCVPDDATTLTFLARQLSNEGLDTATDTGGNTVGADFGGVALHSGSTVFQQVVFDEQAISSADFHVTNFSPDGSVGFGGFVSGTDWQSVAFDLTGLRGQSVTLTAFETNTGDLNFESRLLLANVVLNRAGAAASPEPTSATLVGGLSLFGLIASRRRRRGR